MNEYPSELIKYILDFTDEREIPYEQLAGFLVSGALSIIFQIEENNISKCKKVWYDLFDGYLVKMEEND